jgi:hypothetical protein
VLRSNDIHLTLLDLTVVIIKLLEKFTMLYNKLDCLPIDNFSVLILCLNHSGAYPSGATLGDPLY